MTSRSKCIRVDEPSGLGIIIPGLEVIQVTLLVVYVATVAQGVDHAEGISKRSGGAQNVAVGVIFVAHNNCARSVHDGHYVTLEVCNVVVHRAVVLQRIGLSASGVEKIQRGATAECLPQCAPTVDIHLGVTTGYSDPVVLNNY